MKIHPLLPALFACTTMVPAAANAGTPHGNFSPFLQSLGLQLADTPTDSRWQLKGEVSLTNEFQREASANESLVLDYEQLRLDVSAQRRLNEHWSISISAGFFNQDGGFADSLIDGWHEFFSLPENGRDNAPRDQFSIRYERDGVTLIDLDEGNGLAYAGIGASRTLGQNRALHWTLSVPGSDRYQIAPASKPTLSMAYSQHWDHNTLGQFNAQVGASFRGTAGTLATLQREWLFTGSMGWTYPLLDNIGLRLQLDANSAVYRDTGFETLEAAAGVITVALKTKRWQLGFREDLLIGKGSPDFGVFLSLQHTL
jgi:hypothetical protein